MSHTGENPEPDAIDRERLSEVYKEICNNIRVTDEISFKLLGTVPLAAGIGSGTLTVLEKSELLKGYSGFSVLALSALGSLITVGLFRWELRNIQKCNWFISRAAKLEKLLFPDQKGKVQFGGISSPKDVSASEINEIAISSMLKPPWGKTQAEKLIYYAAIATWFVPMAIALYKLLCKST